MKYFKISLGIALCLGGMCCFTGCSSFARGGDTPLTPAESGKYFSVRKLSSPEELTNDAINVAKKCMNDYWSSNLYKMAEGEKPELYGKYSIEGTESTAIYLFLFDDVEDLALFYEMYNGIIRTKGLLSSFVTDYYMWGSSVE